MTLFTIAMTMWLCLPCSVFDSQLRLRNSNRTAKATVAFSSNMVPWLQLFLLFYVLQNFASPLNQLQQRTWLMHWSLFIFFNHDSGRNGIIDLFFSERYRFIKVDFIRLHETLSLILYGLSRFRVQSRWNMLINFILLILCSVHVVDSCPNALCFEQLDFITFAGT